MIDETELMSRETCVSLTKKQAVFLCPKTVMPKYNTIESYATNF